MIITNKTGLPQAIVDAVKKIRGQYSKGNSDFSATELIKPPYMLKLQRTHEKEIVSDVIDHIWAVRGSAIHHILEQADGGDYMTELRMYAKFNGWTVSGQADLIEGDFHRIIDYKSTSVWSVKNGHKPEWEQQLNTLAELCRRERNKEPKKLAIVAFLKDWRLQEYINAKGRNEYYPRNPVEVVDIPLWDSDSVVEYVFERSRLHKHALDSQIEDVTPCTDDEVWLRDKKWAVYKNTNKRASRLLESREDAEEWVSQQKQSGKPAKWKIVLRPGTRARCDRYCDVARFCKPYQEWRDNNV